MTNNTDTDQLASSEANWSGPTLFANAGYIWAQQVQGLYWYFHEKNRSRLSSSNFWEHENNQYLFSGKSKPSYLELWRSDIFDWKENIVNLFMFIFIQIIS